MTPNSYKDPFWVNLAREAEAEVGLPANMLQNILLFGEKSNTDQVSSAGAKTPFQVIPETRDALLNKYGVDAYADPKTSAKAAALLLKENLERNKGDITQAVGEYIGGTNRKNWGPVTNAYIERVTKQGKPMLTNEQFQRVYSAYESGQMDPEAAREFEADMQAGVFPQMQASGNTTAPTQPSGKEGGITASREPMELPQGVLRAYQEGRMQPSEVAELERDIKAGLVRFPAPKASRATSLPSSSAVSQIPVSPGFAPAPPKPAPSPFERIMGGLEAGASMVAGAVAAPVALVSGAAGGVLGGLIPGGPDAAEGAKMGFNSVMSAVAPRTEQGKQSVQAVGDFLTDTLKLPPVLPIVGPTGALATSALPPGAIARGAQMPGQIAQKTVSAAKAAPDVVARLPEAVRNKLSSMDRFAQRQGSAGAQGVDVETVRREAAKELPVPIDLTKGQASRGFDQTRFERETAKIPDVGEPLRERYAQQRKQILMNMDSFIDQTGAETVNKIQTGKVITSALIKRAKEDKQKIRELYAKAEQSPEAKQPIEIGSIVGYINENKSEAAVSPVLKFTRSKMIELGMASEAPDGALIGRPVTLIQGERLRKAISSATGNDAPDIRQSAILKGLYDSDTENAGGQLYRAARRERENYAKRFENRAVIADLLETKRNSDDRRVALEDVQSRIIDRGSREDLSILMGILDNSGDDGRQALKELRGATLMKIKANATKSAVTDEQGSPIVSADKLNSSIRALDEDGKLDRLYGKKGAEQLRTLADVAKVILTVPPGSVNTSNTASVLAGLMDVALTAGAGGVPVPLATASRLVVGRIKDKKIKKKVEDALNSSQSKDK